MDDSGAVFGDDVELLDEIGQIVGEMLGVPPPTLRGKLSWRLGRLELRSGLTPSQRASLGQHVVAELAGWLEVNRKTLRIWLGCNSSTVSTMWERVGPVRHWSASFRRLVVETGRRLGPGASPENRRPLARIERVAEAIAQVYGITLADMRKRGTRTPTTESRARSALAVVAQDLGLERKATAEAIGRRSGAFFSALATADQADPLLAAAVEAGTRAARARTVTDIRRAE